MKSLFHRTFHRSPVPLSSRRLISSLSLGSTSNSHAGSLKDPVASDPFFSFSATAGRCDLSATETKIFHAWLTKTPLLKSNLYIAEGLVGSYSKSGALEEALHLLVELPHPNLVAWNAIISNYNKCSHFDGSFRAFLKMRSLGFCPTQFTYGSVLSACTASHDVLFGEQVFSLVMKNGFFSDGYVFTGLVDLFAKCGSFDEALSVFTEILADNVVCWNAIISGGVRNGENRIALDLFCQMVKGHALPNGFTFPSVLCACAQAGELEAGKGIHGWVVKYGVDNDVFVGTAIVDLYAKCGHIDDAVKSFSLMPFHNVVSWTTIISGFVQADESAIVMKLFIQMIQSSVEINKYTVTSVLKACAKPTMVKEANQVHCWILKSEISTDSVLRDALVTTYAKIGDVQMSEKVFEEQDRVENVGSWAAIITGLAQNQRSRRSIELFLRMFREGLRPDKFCSSSVLSIVNCVDLGKQIHSYMVKSGLMLDVSVGSALLTMYSKCGSLEHSFELFKQMPERDRIAWTSMIAGFAEHGFANEAFQLFRKMILEEIEPDKMTLAAALAACSTPVFLNLGKEIHGHVVRVGLGSDMLIGGALITMYSKSRTLDFSIRVFNGMPQKDHISWSSLISGYAQNGYGKGALLEFHQMVLSGYEIDCFSCSSVLGVCAILSRPTLGRQLHAHIMKASLYSYPSVSSSLVTMYSKCGSIHDSRKVFDQIEEPDLITWTSMIDGYAQHGNGGEALKLYEMMKINGTEPDSVTFVGVLSACSHNGLVEEGFLHFRSMDEVYGIKPETCHYACVVDLLGRSGRLKEAASFIDQMPIKADGLVWSTLLGACQLHGNTELGRLAAKKVLELEPSDSAAYVSLSNMCADIGSWEEVLKIRSLMRGVGVNKEPGWSSV